MHQSGEDQLVESGHEMSDNESRGSGEHDMESEEHETGEVSESSQEEAESDNDGDSDPPDAEPLDATTASFGSLDERMNNLFSYAISELNSQFFGITFSGKTVQCTKTFKHPCFN